MRIGLLSFDLQRTDAPLFYIHIPTLPRNERRRIMNCYPLPVARGSGYTAAMSFQPFSSKKSAKKSSHSKPSAKTTTQPVDYRTNNLGTQMKKHSSSSSIDTFESVRGSPNDYVSLSRTTTKSSKSGKSTKTKSSSKSSRSWIRRVFSSEDASEDEDPQAKLKERNAMWRNMSMGYDVCDFRKSVSANVAMLTVCSPGPFTTRTGYNRSVGFPLEIQVDDHTPWAAVDHATHSFSATLIG